jgi:hypothetical protein
MERLFMAIDKRCSFSNELASFSRHIRERLILNLPVKIRSKITSQVHRQANLDVAQARWLNREVAETTRRSVAGAG